MDTGVPHRAFQPRRHFKPVSISAASCSRAIVARNKAGAPTIPAPTSTSAGRQQFDEQIARALPPARFPIADLTPPSDHPLWRIMYPVRQLQQNASIQTWRRSGDILERWNDEGAPPTARAIADEQGRIMVLMVHNTDLPDPWEREGEDKDYFYRFSPDAYAAGINIVLYAMSH